MRKKKLVAQRAAKVNQMVAAGVNPSKAIEQLQREQGSRIWSQGKFVLAQAYAIALTDHYRQQKTGKFLGSLFAQVVSSFEDACKARARSKFRNRLRLKRRGDPTTCRVQFRRSPFRHSEPRGKHEMNWIDLGALFPPSSRQALRWVPVRQHRPLPIGSKVTQIAVTRDRISWHAAVTIQCDKTSIAKYYPEANGRIAGINPSRNVAFTIVPADSPDFGQSDGRMVTAPSDSKKLFRRVAKLMRKADRQRRAANPDSYRPDGTIIKGCPPVKISRNLQKTLCQLTELHSRFKAIRAESYHLAADELLSQFDTIRIGSWQGLNPRAKSDARRNREGKARPKGKAALERRRNRLDAAHAFSDFKRILREKAAKSITQKNIEKNEEAFTTRICPACGADTGPRGERDLSVRVWTCFECGRKWQRDKAAAWHIAVDKLKGKQYKKEPAAAHAVRAEDSAKG
jgi:transposase